MTALFHSLLAESGLPPVPDSVEAAHFISANSEYAVMPARQTTLEPSNGSGTDQPMSWSFWVWINNYAAVNSGNRLLSVSETATASSQYGISLIPYNSATINQCLGIAFLNAAQTANIQAYTGTKVKRARWLHVVFTYDGSEVNTGINIYINAVLDAAPQRFSAGSYTGVGSSAAYRFQISDQFTPASRPDMIMRDLCVWNRVITGSEVSELFNGGQPIDVDTLSFYAAAIRAYWPLRTNTTCLNNAALNLTNVNTITFDTFPVSPTYGSISLFNAVPGNTRYMGFGSLFPVGGIQRYYCKSGTSHVAGGKVVKMEFDTANFTVTGPTDVIPNPGDTIGPSTSAVVGSDIQIEVLRSTSPAGVPINNSTYKSTDGLTGTTFGSPSVVSTPGTNGTFFGKIIPSYTPGEYVSMYYELTGSTYSIYLATYASGAWTFQSIYSASSGVRLVEPALIKVGNNTYICLARHLTVDLYMLYSTDGGATWTAPAATGLGIGICNADGCITASGRLSIIWMDRGTGTMRMSTNNVVSDVLADPTDWVGDLLLFVKYTGDSVGMLGYPSIVADGYFAAVQFCAEFSLTRADIIFGYGQIDPGF